MSCIILSFLCFVHIVNCQVYVSLQATTTVVYQQDKIQFTCTPVNVAGTDSISDIILQKNSTIYNWRDVVRVFTDISTGQLIQKVIWTDTNMQNRTTVIKSVTTPTNSAGLKIEISADNVACNDEGNYRCTIGGNRAFGGKLDSQSTQEHVGLVVQANSIDSIRVYPQMSDNTYDPGTIVTLTCTGDVGNPAGDLRWCIRREGIDISFTGYPNPEDIIQEPAMLSGCQYRRSSKLSYNVSSTIPVVDFRCETGPMATCGLSSTIAAKFTLMTFYIVTCQYVSIQAPSQVNYHRDKLPFACTPSGVGGTDSITDITLQKIYSTGWQDVVKVYADTTTGSLQHKVLWTDTNMQGRASVNMSVVAPTNGAGLRIEINADNVACTDEGNYRCSIAGNKNGGGKLDSQSAHTRVGLIVQANSIESLQVNPRMPENIYNPGTPVTLTCTGDVGNPAGDLRWCIKREGIDISFTGYPNPADISQGTAMLSGCQYRRSSTLTYNVSFTIPEVDFRCETGPLATCGLSSTIAANFTIIRHTEQVYTGSQISPFTEPANTVSQSSPFTEPSNTESKSSTYTVTANTGSQNSPCFQYKYLLCMLLLVFI